MLDVVIMIALWIVIQHVYEGSEVLFCLNVVGKNHAESARFDAARDNVRKHRQWLLRAWHEIVLLVRRMRRDLRFQLVLDRKSTRLNSSHIPLSRMPSS